jgi:hypothetical protein
MKNVVQERGELEQKLYDLVHAQKDEQLSLIKTFKDNQGLYALVTEELNRLSLSLERRQNQGRRKHLVGVFASLVGIKILLEVHYPHLND